MPDLVDEIFGDEEETAFYPGSRHKRTIVPAMEFIPDDWHDNYTEKTFGGVAVRMYPIGAMADALGVSVPTIRSWTKLGYIPQAPYRLPSNMIVGGQQAAGRRLYTAELIESVVEIFQKHGLLGQQRVLWKEHPGIPIEIVETWSRIQQASKFNKETSSR